MYPPIENITIEHIQGYLFAHQSLVNANHPSSGSMKVFDTFYSNNVDDDVIGVFVEEVIRGLREWRDYNSEFKDRGNFKNQFLSNRSSTEEFVETIDVWFLDQTILGSKSTQSSANTLVQLFEGLLGNEFEIYKLVIDSDFIDSNDYPWFMAAAWGMAPFDLFLLKNSYNQIILRFGEIVI